MVLRKGRANGEHQKGIVMKRLALILMTIVIAACAEPLGPQEKCGDWKSHEIKITNVMTGEITVDTVWTQYCKGRPAPVLVP